MNKSKWIWIIFAIAAIIFLWPSSWFDFTKLFKFNDVVTTQEDEIIKKNKKTIDSLQKLLTAESLLRAQYESRANQIEDSLDQLKIEIENDQLKIQSLRNEIKKKSGAVVNFSSDELTKFITNRYQDSLPTQR